MTSTPRTELERQLSAAMTPRPRDLTVDATFTRATVARAARARCRRRLAYAIGAPLAAAAVTAGIVTAVDHEVRPATTPGVQEPGPTPDPEPGPVPVPADGPVSLARWLENRTAHPTYIDNSSEPAAPGTVMYRSCAGGDCAVTLVAPSGGRIDLADVHPELATSLASDGLVDVSLSPTGHWLGRPEEGGYRIYNLQEPDVVVEVAAGSSGDRWELVGWSPHSWAPALAQYDGDIVTRYVNWDSLRRTAEWEACCTGFAGPRREAPRFVDVPGGVVTTPIMGSVPDALPVTEPVQPVGDELPRVADTTPPTNEWLSVGGLESYSRRGVDPAVIDASDRDYGTSFEECVGADETLVGPDGRLHRWQVRGSRDVHGDVVTNATPVYSRDPLMTEPVAVVLEACDGGPWPDDRVGSFWDGIPEGGRLDLPTTTADETWTFLGMLPDGQVALLRESDGMTVYVRLEEDGELTDLHELADGAEVVVPGGVVG